MDKLLGRFKLNRAFLQQGEVQLCALLKPFLAFREHSLYFPDYPLRQAELLAAERRILTPVLWQGRPVAALRLENCQPLEARPLLPVLPKLAGLCLRSLALGEAARLDEETSLYSEESLLASLAERISASADDCRDARRRDCFGLIIVDWPQAEAVASRAGYQARADLWRKMARALAGRLPKNAMAANMGAKEWLWQFAILVPAFGRAFCQAIAKNLFSAMLAEQVRDPYSEGGVPIHLTVGHAIFPQDMQGADLRRPAGEQALLLRDRARLAASAASHASRGLPILSFGSLLRRGGVVRENLGHNHLRISLGKSSYARPGMRFYVFPPGDVARACKAEIVIRKTANQDSIAEVFHQESGNAPMPGDCLVLFPGSKDSDRPDGLRDHLLFFDEFGRQSASWAKYGLSITKFANAPAGTSPRGLARIFADSLKNSSDNKETDLLAGYYGKDGLAVFWPGASADEIGAKLANAHTQLKNMGARAASGIFAWPCLNFSRSDSESCCLKALEYAGLLPEPHIGALNHLALAVSGDRKFSQGDELGAMEDYKLALVLKPDDPLVLNSLAVCMAAMNKPRDAAGLLEKALAAHPDRALRVNICYNLGNIWQKEKENGKAARYYKECIKADAGHAWAWLRFGQIHAAAGRPKLARAIYHHACRMAEGQPDLLNIARRQLARLAAATSDADGARDALHDALLQNPSDVNSLLLLAKTYLDDDPATAETLARKCLRLGADAWDILAKALAKQGRGEESRMVKNRA